MIRNARCFLLLAATLGLAALSNARAGLINVNLTDATLTGRGADGTAILGGGTWNRIQWGDANAANALVGSNGAALAGVTAKDAAFPAGPGVANGNGNVVQDESWISGVDLTISGLTANQLYRVAVYSDRIGGGDNTYTVNGMAKVLPPPGASAAAVLPGAENVDYALYLVNASATGTITIEAPVMAGFQIEGVLPGEAGPQADATISDRASRIGKGDGKYTAKPRKSQTLVQDTKGKRPRRYFVRAGNDGSEIDHFLLSGGWSRKKVKVKVVDLDRGANVTAEIVAGTYRYLLDEGESQQFKIIAKPKKRKSGKLKVRMTASPSTRAISSSDVVVGLTNVVR